MPSNDNEPATDGGAPPVDPHGHAALLLIESMIHGLCEAATLTANEALTIVQRAADVQAEQAGEAEGSAVPPMWRSHALLQAIAASLEIDGHSDR